MMENERVLISLKSGDIYLITLLSDGMRSIKKFSWLKAATSVLTSCLCMATGQSKFSNCTLLFLDYLVQINEPIFNPNL